VNRKVGTRKDYTDGKDRELQEMETGSKRGKKEEKVYPENSLIFVS
jgi:hypothetical protein